MSYEQEQNRRKKIKFNEDLIQKKLYGEDQSSPQEKNSILDEQLLSEQMATEEAAIREEFSKLKKTIASLEGKLEHTENQKKRLMRKLLQKRIISNLSGKFFDALAGGFPKKIIILLPVLIISIFFLCIIFNAKKPLKPAMREKARTENIAEKEQKKMTVPVPQDVDLTTAEAQPEGMLYTIQAAEYANAEAAQRFVETLENQGYLVVVDTTYRNNDMDKPYFKIDVGIFKTLAEANNFREEFKRKTGISDAFIKEKK